ncbi:hypothetical protein C3747_55g142 [Trypanosoma cruzi]|uniref:Uncharacterized protein n=1 Tax=Trypanosoma cruzi TaxID=5693 RepID=A0A2V2WUP2_TRYCR|nr:hypothetical protein C3747_55g142 [Trypanosoma cruzi]
MMENSPCAVDQGSSPYESPAAAESGRRSRGFYVWVFLCQLLTLLWKESLERARRPWKAVMEILAPAVMILILFYAVELSPVVWIDSFNHSRLPDVTFQHNIPNESLVTNDWEADLEAVSQWRGVFSELNMTSFFSRLRLDSGGAARTHERSLPPQSCWKGVERVEDTARGGTCTSLESLRRITLSGPNVGPIRIHDGGSSCCHWRTGDKAHDA